MRKLSKFVAVSLIATTLTTVGCSTWWSNFKKDPVAQTETLIQSVQVILSIATVTFASVKAALPADKQPIAQVKFDEAVLAVNGAIDALHASIRAAADLQESKPDFSKVVADLMTAVAGLQAVVDEFKVLMTASPSPATSTSAGSPVKLTAAPAEPRGYDVMVSKIGALKKRSISMP
jgi:hypothetical protein